MINKIYKIKIPKKIKSFYYNDIDFNIQDFVLNKDITNIPGNGNLIKTAINMKKTVYWILTIFFVLGFFTVIFFFLNIPIYSGIWHTHKQLEIIHIFGIIASVLWPITWIIFLIDFFGIIFVYANKKIKFILNYFNKLVEEKKLVSDLKKYPVIFVMAFYYKNRSQFKIDYPNTYPAFSPYFALVALGIFFDRLYDYVNPNKDA